MGNSSPINYLRIDTREQKIFHSAAAISRTTTGKAAN